MRKFTYLLLFIAAFSHAQVTLSTAELVFGDVLTTGDKELAVDVTNNTSGDLVIDEVNIFGGDYSYTLANATITPGGKQKIRVTFEPKHNLVYNSELIIVLSDGSEHRVDLAGNGRYEGTYYSTTFNKSYQDLKDELKSIISAGYVSLSYNVARDNMYADLDNVGGKVTCVYTGRVATMSSRSDANNNSINCEHTWPQSKFNSQTPERSDIHHLFPTDVNSNSRRGSYAFGTVSSASWTEGGSKQGGSLFEPRDVQKGATARAMMYFVIRYKDWGTFFGQQEAILKQWHNDYAPSVAEMQRNDGIFSLQKNRNPFVDHPEFMERINNLGSTDTKPEIKEASISQPSITYTGLVPSDQRTVYVVNTGNVDWSSVASATSASGNIKIISTDATAAVGEPIAITIGFEQTADGTYTDNLQLDLQSQANKSYNIPITYTIGISSNSGPSIQKIKTNYNPQNQSLSILNVPSDANDLEIYNTSGELVLKNSSFTDIPFNGHTQGVYFVVIKTKEEVFSSKFLVY